MHTIFSNFILYSIYLCFLDSFTCNFEESLINHAHESKINNVKKIKHHQLPLLVSLMKVGEFFKTVHG